MTSIARLRHRTKVTLIALAAVVGGLLIGLAPAAVPPAAAVQAGQVLYSPNLTT